MRAPVLFLVALVACTRDTDTDTDSGDTDLGSPPEAVIDTPSGPLVLGPIVLTGRATDPDQPAMTLWATFTSSVDGELWADNPPADGLWRWEGDPTPAEHTFELVVTDAKDNISRAELTALVRTNDDPTCTIVEPANGSEFPRNTDILFSVDWSDPDGDEVEFRWTSSLVGALFLGESYTWRLTQGTHTVTVNGEDPFGGTCTDSVEVTVGP